MIQNLSLQEPGVQKKKKFSHDICSKTTINSTTSSCKKTKDISYDLYNLPLVKYINQLPEYDLNSRISFLMPDLKITYGKTESNTNPNLQESKREQQASQGQLRPNSEYSSNYFTDFNNQGPNPNINTTNINYNAGINAINVKNDDPEYDYLAIQAQDFYLNLEALLLGSETPLIDFHYKLFYLIYSQKPQDNQENDDLSKFYQVDRSIQNLDDAVMSMKSNKKDIYFQNQILYLRSRADNLTSIIHNMTSQFNLEGDNLSQLIQKELQEFSKLIKGIYVEQKVEQNGFKIELKLFNQFRKKIHEFESLFRSFKEILITQFLNLNRKDLLTEFLMELLSNQAQLDQVNWKIVEGLYTKYRKFKVVSVFRQRKKINQYDPQMEYSLDRMIKGSNIVISNLKIIFNQEDTIVIPIYHKQLPSLVSFDILSEQNQQSVIEVANKMIAIVDQQNRKKKSRSKKGSKSTNKSIKQKINQKQDMMTLIHHSEKAMMGFLMSQASSIGSDAYSEALK